MAIAPLAIAGMAMSAAGAGLNFMQKKQQESKADELLRASRKRVEANTAMARADLQRSMDLTTKGQQEADKAANEAKRGEAYDAATQDAASVALAPQSDAPQVVKSESAKQLGDQLSKARDLMAARAKLGGWSDTLFNNSMQLNRNARDINMWGNFSLGDEAAAQQDAAATRAHKGLPIGDILMGAGGALTMAGGGIGAAAAPAAGAGTALPLTGTVYSAATAPASSGWWSKAAKGLTTPINFW